MVKKCFVIFACLALGHLIVWLSGLHFPPSIIGMIILAAGLQLKVIKMSSVKEFSDFLISNMGFFFVPPGVALMLYFDLIEAEIWPIVVATLVSTILVLVTTGWSYHLTKHGKFKEFFSKLKKD